MTVSNRGKVAHLGDTTIIAGLFATTFDVRLGAGAVVVGVVIKSLENAQYVSSKEKSAPSKNENIEKPGFKERG